MNSCNPTRRRYLTIAGLTLSAGVAGCTSSDEPNESDATEEASTPSDESNESDTTEETDTVEAATSGRVTNEDTGSEYPALEEAIDEADSEETLRLHEGVHGLGEEVGTSSGPVRINKELVIDESLALVGDEGAVVEAELRVRSDNVTVANLSFEEFRSSAGSHPRLLVKGSEVVVADNAFDGYRVDVEGPHFSAVEVSGNTFQDAPLAVVYTDSVAIQGNTFTGDNAPNQLVSVASSDDTAIESNHIEATGVPLQVGNSMGVTVSQNNIISTGSETALYANQPLDATENYWEGSVDTPIGWPSDEVDVEPSPVNEPYSFADEH